jgi:hypothetical protein
MFFKNCLPFLTLLAGRLVVFLTPMPRYLYTPPAVRTRSTLPTDVRPGSRRTSGKPWLTAKTTTRTFFSPAGCADSQSEIRVSVFRSRTRTVPDYGMKILSTPPTRGTRGFADRMRKKPETTSGTKRAGSTLGSTGKKPRMEVPRPQWVVESWAATARQDGGRSGLDRGRGMGRARGMSRGRGWPRGRGGGGDKGRGAGSGRGRGSYF